MNELSLVLPGDGWHESTLHRLEIPTAEDDRIRVEVTRGDPMSGERLNQHVDDELKGHGRKLRGFELLGREAFEVADVAGISASFRMVTTDGGVHVELAYVPLERTLLTFTITAPAAQAGACREVVVRAIESIRLRAREGR